jgi:acyl-CoA reductase-like NAD-dependent aldehyde dehydrogenase
MLHIPVLRSGRSYRSLTTNVLRDFRNGEPVAEVSQANAGLITKDISAAGSSKRILQNIPVTKLLNICSRAAELFAEAELPIGDDAQTPQDYVRAVSKTTGMPEVLCIKNMAKIQSVLLNMEAVLRGLTRGLDLSILDSKFRIETDRPLNFYSEADILGVVLPNNSPGVHSVWLPAIPLKTPLALKPGREEPWTPFRIAQAFITAGCPPEAFSYYPTDHGNTSEILMACGRSLLFGDTTTLANWIKDPRIELHGPGCSKIFLGSDVVDDWKSYQKLMVASVLENGGRSCINASGVWVTRNGKSIAEALARELAQITPADLEDPDAKLCAFTNAKAADRLDQLIDSQLKLGGAEDLTSKFRKGSSRCVRTDGASYLLPTVIWCEDPAHPLANTEYLFPFVSVVELPENEMIDRMGHTLVLTAITRDSDLIRQLLSAPNIERLNLGPIPTNQVAWDQPHEGNLFQHLYTQRALQLETW